MTTTQDRMTTRTAVHAPAVVRSIRARLSARRQAALAHRRLQDDLATFRTPSEIADLMALVDSTEGPDAEEIRGMLNRNLAAFYRRSAWVA
ncbi:MAG TPA: hypothetical protein PLQ23_13290 [Dermatophilaceae bacterium]|nr:hypothetical protein [Dermatophilaceae bacterium]